ncbi:MAG: Type pilin PilA [Candidatus Saccharibacteria bacterium]|nr:Type pilin PilA [Candidatus Saccharibacteria bacterium]
MKLPNIKKMKSEKGFTIVELLIVIVVIGILAAIVIVAYSGVTSRANNTDAQAASATVAKKAEAYYADPIGGNGSYPTTFAQIGSAASSQTFSLAGSGVILNTAAAAITAKPASAKTIDFYQCGAAVGNAIGVWNYTTNAVNFDYTGGAQSSGTGAGTTTTLPASPNPVTCTRVTS